MEKSGIHQEDFEISIIFNGSTQAIRVKPEETTDGAEYFKCSIKDEHITQVRQEKDGNWEQIWGDLDNLTVQSIGKAINVHPR